jgi:hypothetical protein
MSEAIDRYHCQCHQFCCAIIGNFNKGIPKFILIKIHNIRYKRLFHFHLFQFSIRRKMMQALQELTAGASCWTNDALRYATRALKEIENLRERDAQQLVRRDAPSEADLASFNQWLSVHADAAKVKVQRAGDHGNGLIAQDALQQGDTFISIPYGIILGADPSLGPVEKSSGPWNHVAQDPLLSRFPSCLLALRVLNEACKTAKTRPSFFAPYIAMLPASFDIPLFYSVSDFEAIDGTPLFEPAVKLLYNSIKQFFYLQRLCQQGWPQCPIPAAALTLSNYFWAMGVVLTRQNEVVVGEAGRGALALIPGWDMCNHEAGERIGTFSDPAKRVVVCHAKRAFAVDEEVAMFYGPRTNEQLLMYSGFVDDANAWDRTTIQLALNASDPLLKIRRLIIQKELAKDSSVALGDESVQIQVGTDGSLVSYAALRVLQILNLSKESLTKALRSSATLGADKVFEWTSEERELAKQRFAIACEDADRQLLAFISKVAGASRGALFRRYFESQRSAVALAKQNTVVFDA